MNEDEEYRERVHALEEELGETRIILKELIDVLDHKYRDSIAYQKFYEKHGWDL